MELNKTVHPYVILDVSRIYLQHLSVIGRGSERLPLDKANERCRCVTADKWPPAITLMGWWQYKSGMVMWVESAIFVRSPHLNEAGPPSVYRKV